MLKWDQLEADPEIPIPVSPDSRSFGRESGKESPRDSRFGRNRESGSRFAANREIESGMPVCVSAACTILGWMLPSS